VYLGSSEIKRRIIEERLLANCSIENVQGAGVDLRIEKLFEICGRAYLGTKKRKLPKLVEKNDAYFILAPGMYYLCVTTESVNMPQDLIAFILPRSTLFRAGVSLRTAVVDPGYKGALTIGIKNEGPLEFKLKRSARIAQIVFSEVKGNAEEYNGKYQGGKVV
jgi:deoxycytidine triphosphate deaminase